jgi:hypothetical protein
LEDRVRYERARTHPADGLFGMKLLADDWDRHADAILLDERDKH